MKNIYGMELSKSNIENAVSIAMDLQMYGYSFEYFYSEYTDRLNKKDSLSLWNEAKKQNKKCVRKSVAEIYFS